MFVLIKFDEKHGKFEEASSHPDILSATDALGRKHTESSPHFVTWTNPQKLSGEQEDKMLREALAANQGRVLRVSKNVAITVAKLDETKVCCGAGSSCFCVQYSNGTRQCETNYCNGSGYCWTVPCNVPCGC